MKDEEIVMLFHHRDERAIAETQKKYQKYLLKIAKNILYDDEDARECENDVYLRLWNAIPPAKPEPFKPYLAAVCRSIALNRYAEKNSARRGGGQTAAALEELVECLPDNGSDDPADLVSLKETLESFLAGLPQRERVIFLKRYWFMTPVKQIASEMHLSQTNVSVLLHRTRAKLKDHLTAEGYSLPSDPNERKDL